MTTKLKIDLTGGVLEVEGSEAFVKAIYNDFKAHFIGDEAVTEEFFKPRRGRIQATVKAEKAAVSEPPQPIKPEPVPEADVVETPPVIAPPEPPQTIPPPKEPVLKPSYTYLNDLELTAADGRPSLVEYMDAKFPITNEERNLVFLYYLENMVNLKTVTIDHIYTCYRAVKIRAPLDLNGSLQSTIEQRHWIKMTKSGKLSVTSAGKAYVENQLPKKVKN
jgi:hypothetical protein